MIDERPEFLSEAFIVFAGDSCDFIAEENIEMMLLVGIKFSVALVETLEVMSSASKGQFLPWLSEQYRRLEKELAGVIGE